MLFSTWVHSSNKDDDRLPDRQRRESGVKLPTPQSLANFRPLKLLAPVAIDPAGGYCRRMGIYDRGYMKDPERNRPYSAAPSKPSKETSSLSLWQRLRFKLWLLLHPKRR